MTAVRCIDLCKTYRQGDEDIKALDHVSIEIDQGGFVCLWPAHRQPVER